MTLVAQVIAVLNATAVTETYRREDVPDDAVFPYASIIDPISDGVLLQGDALTLARRRVLQVDLWLDRDDDQHDDLLDQVVNALDGTRVEDGRLRVTDANQIVDPEDEVIHHAVTVSLARLR